MSALRMAVHSVSTASVVTGDLDHNKLKVLVKMSDVSSGTPRSFGLSRNGLEWTFGCWDGRTSDGGPIIEPSATGDPNHTKMSDDSSSHLPSVGKP